MKDTLGTSKERPDGRKKGKEYVKKKAEAKA
jgi:hypothetical protein